MNIAGTHVNVQWEVYWQEVEATIAVIMISIMTFRSLFGLKTIQSREKKMHQAWYSDRGKFYFTRSTRNSSGVCGNVGERDRPVIPGATMTGLQSFIRGGKGMRTLMGQDEHEYMSSTNNWKGSKMDITVTHDIMSVSEKVRSMAVIEQKLRLTSLSRH
jgi:hypothetical protein